MSTTIPMMEVPVPSIEEVELDAYLFNGKTSDALLTERQNLKKMQDDADRRIHEIDGELGAALDLRGIKNVIWNNCIVSRREAAKPRQILDRGLLMQAGVTPLQLQAGTKLGEPGKSGVTVRRIPEKSVGGSPATDERGFTVYPV